MTHSTHHLKANLSPDLIVSLLYGPNRTDDIRQDDGHEHSPEELFAYLTRVMYNRCGTVSVSRFSVRACALSARRRARFGRAAVASQRGRP